MIMMTMEEFARKYAIVFFRVTTWSGRRNNCPKDLGLENESISSEVATLGGKSVFDKKKLAFMTSTKKAEEANLDKIGFRCYGGWAVPKPLLAETVRRLEAAEVEFNRQVDALLQSYEQECEAWIIAAEKKVTIEGFANAIRRSLYKKEYIRGQVSFRFSVNDDLMNNPIGDAAITTISDMAAESLRQFKYSMEHNNAFGRRSLGYVTRLKTKLVELAMVDSFVDPAIEVIQQFEDQWPAKGEQLPIGLMSDLMGLLALLADPSYLVSLRQSDLRVATEEEELEAARVSSGVDLDLAKSLDDLFASPGDDVETGYDPDELALACGMQQEALLESLGLSY